MNRYLRLEDTASEENKALAANLKRRRKALGLSQGDLSVLASVAASHLSFMENARANPTLEVLTQLAEALQCKVVDLLEPVEESD